MLSSLVLSLACVLYPVNNQAGVFRDHEAEIRYARYLVELYPNTFEQDAMYDFIFPNWS